MKVSKKLLAITGLLISGCAPQSKTTTYLIKQCQNQDQTHTKYQACDLSDIKDYYDVGLDYLDESDKVILYLEGGPSLSTTIDLKEAEIKKGNDNFFNALSKNKISFLMVNQAHWMKLKKYQEGNIDKWTPSDAQKENQETIDITHKVIEHLQNQGKKVLLYGLSYGAILVNQYLSKYGDDLPDYVLSSVARLKMKNTKKFLDAFAIAAKHPHSQIYVRANDEIDDEANTALKYITKESGIKNFWKMALDMGFRSLIKDYTQSIKDANLNKTTFVSVEPDRRVGWFNQEEISWARNRGAKVDLIKKEETKKSYIKYYYQGGEPAETAINWYGHLILGYDQDRIQKYFIDPFTK